MLTRPTRTLLSAFTAHAADQLQAPMTLVGPDGTGKMIGHVTITESKRGLVFTPNLTSLPPGAHGFHVHESASCRRCSSTRMAGPARRLPRIACGVIE